MDRGPYAAQPETMASCARCAALIERRTAAYSQHGEPLCSDCAMRDEIAVNEAGSAVYMKGVAYGSLALAVFGLVYNPFHLMSFVLVLNGVLLARQLIGEAAWYRRRLGWHYWPALISVFVSATVGGLLVLMPLAAVSLAIYGG